MSPSRPILLAAALMLLGGCAGTQVADTEQMLAAAGFTTEPATTSGLQALPPHRLFARPATAGTPPSYAYADPDQCRCIYVGGPSQYQYFQQLAVQKRIADEQMSAAMMNEDAALNLAVIPPPVVIVHEHR